MPENFRRLYEEYSSPLFRYILRFTANAEAAEEILQDVFEQYLAGKYTEDDRANLKGWLYTLARNKCINQAKSGKRNVALIEESMTTETAEVQLMEFERARSLINLEARMPDELRQTWALRKQGQNYQMIAENLSIPLGTVKSRFHRLVEYLRKELGNEA